MLAILGLTKALLQTNCIVRALSESNCTTIDDVICICESRLLWGAAYDCFDSDCSNFEKLSGLKPWR